MGICKYTKESWRFFCKDLNWWEKCVVIGVPLAASMFSYDYLQGVIQGEKWTLDKSKLDTFIVIISLLGLMSNNFVEAFSAEKCRIVVLKSILLLVLTVMAIFCGLNFFLAIFNGGLYWLFFLICVILCIFAFLCSFQLHNSNVKDKQIESLCYGIFWLIILISYGVSVRIA